MDDKDFTADLDEQASESDDDFDALEEDADDLEDSIASNEEMDEKISVPDEDDALGLGEDAGAI